MTSELPQLLYVDALRAECRSDRTRVVTSDRIRSTVEDWLGAPLAPVDWADATSVVAIGGGSVIDAAKLAAFERGVARVVGVPTLWGSGAEASPVAVRWEPGCEPVLDERLRPAARAYVPEFVGRPDQLLISSACADTWSHALEGYLSPLGDASLRGDLAEVIGRLLTLRVELDLAWFEVSAAACAGQARSSVGLVHGLAHTTEAARRRAGDDRGWHHARYCRTFLYPALRFDLESSPKAAQRFAEHGIEPDAVVAAARTLFDEADYAELLPVVRAEWSTVVRDLCTRTNVALVRPGALAWFEEFAP